MEPVIIISTDQSVRANLVEVWRKRDVLFLLVWRDFLVRYKQTFVGLLWSLFRPLATMIIFTVIFGRVLHLPSGATPYPLIVLSGLLPWLLFANTVPIGGTSLLDNASVIRKSYCPRLIYPLSLVFINFGDFLVSLLFFLTMTIFYGHHLDTKLFFLPVLILHAIGLTLGVMFFIAALSVRFRDLSYLVPFFIQLGFFVSPIGYLSSLVAVKWRLIYALNPMTGIIDGFRWSLLGGDVRMYWLGYELSVGISAFILISGTIYFIKSEKKFMDLL
jgi:lipopolysaccharide transport system permease protein